MTTQKTFSTFSDQVKWLETKKHLVISDKEHAENILCRIGYFPLMGGIQASIPNTFNQNI